MLGLVCAVLALGLTAGVARGETQLQQSTPIAWDEYHSDCSGGEALVLDPGQMLWYFKLSGAQSDEGNLSATFAHLGERATVGAMVNGTLHFMFVTNTPETLLGAQTGVDGERLDLSHVCAMKVADPQPDPSQSPTATATPAPDKTPKPKPKPTATPTPAPDPTPRPTRAPRPTASPPPVEEEPTPAATLDPTPSPAPSEAVLPPTPAATSEPTPSPTPLATVTAPAPLPTAEPEPSATPLPAVFVPTSNEPPASSGLDPLYIVVGAGLLVGLVTLLIALRGSLRRGSSARVLG